MHIHVAEAIEDRAAGERLDRFVNDDWLLVHAVHLDRPLEGTIAHNPVSNMNNAVGYARPSQFTNRIVLGTDGIGGNMLEAFRFAFFRRREDEPNVSPDQVWAWLEAGWDIFPEARSDRVEWSYDPMEPWHLAFTPGVRPRKILVGGECVLEDGLPTKVDASEIRAKAREQARRLFARL